MALHHVVEGTPGGPALVLSGSLGTDVGLWDEQVPLLGHDLRLVRYDLRGHGRSPVPPGPYSIADLGRDLLAVLDELGLERASLCGISIGGMASLWAAAHAPERVERLILCCTSARPGAAEAWADRAATVRRAGLEGIADLVVSRWFTPAWAASHRARVAQLRATLVGLSPAGYAACCDALVDLDLRAELPAVRAPTMIIAGEQDPAFPVAHARALAVGIRSSRLVILAGASHLASVDSAATVSGLILDHLGFDRRGTAPPGASGG